METFVGRFVGRVVESLVDALGRKLRTGQIGAVACVHAAVATVRAANVAAAVWVVISNGLVSTGWIADHRGWMALALAAAYYVFVVCPTVLVSQMLQVSRGERSNLGELTAIHARRNARSDLSVAAFVFLSATSLLGALAGFTGTNIAFSAVMALFACGWAADAVEGVAWRNQRVQGLVVSSLPE